MSMELDDFKHKAGGEITALTDRIGGIAAEKGIDIGREFIYNILEDAVEKIHESKFIKKISRKVSKYVKRRIRGILKW